MNIPTNRTPLNTPQMRCGDPCAMMDESGSNEFPQVVPSIPCDHLEPTKGQLATRAIERTDYLSRQNVKLIEENRKLRQVLGLQLRNRGLTEAVYSDMELKFAPPLELKDDALGNTRVRIDL